MQGPFSIVLHHTGGSFASGIVTLTEPGKAAGGEVGLPQRPDRQGRDDLRALRVPEEGVARGRLEPQELGIEIVNRGTPADPYPPAQIEAVVWRARERRRTLGIPADLTRIKRHRDIQADKVDTSDTFPYEEVRRRIVAATDPTDDGAPAPDVPVPADEFALEKYNVAGLGLRHGVMATAFAGALRAEGVSAMSVHSAPSVAFTAKRASVAILRAGPRLVVLGKPAADAVIAAGHRLGDEPFSDIFDAVGAGTDEDLEVADTITKALELLTQIGAAERRDAARMKKHFKAGLIGLSSYFADKV